VYARGERKIDSDLTKAVRARRRDGVAYPLPRIAVNVPRDLRRAIWISAFGDGLILLSWAVAVRVVGLPSVHPSVGHRSARPAQVASPGPGCGCNLPSVQRDSSSRNAYTGVSEDQGGWTGRGVVGARTQDRLGGSAGNQECSRRRHRRRRRRRRAFATAAVQPPSTLSDASDPGLSHTNIPCTTAFRTVLVRTVDDFL